MKKSVKISIIVGVCLFIASVITKNNKLYISYTYKRELIKFCEVEV